MSRLLRDIVLIVVIGGALLAGALTLGAHLAPDRQPVEAALGAATRPLRSAAGRSLHAALKAGGLLIEKPLLAEAVRAAVTTLPEDHHAIPIYLLALDTPNALAAPDGTVYLTTGLFATLESLPQLTAIISHEIGHIENNHASKALIREMGIAGLLGAAGLADAARLVAGVVGASFSREAEREADEFAYATLAASGVDPSCFADALRLLAAHNDGGEVSPMPAMRYLDSHPDIDERVRDARLASRTLARGGWRPAAGVADASFAWRRVQEVAASARLRG